MRAGDLECFCGGVHAIAFLHQFGDSMAQSGAGIITKSFS
jgi:hypothetical protein